ncbi:MAG: M1 family metallopeptidase [Bacteroidales bacterium]|nr:M1 family metallopeptidase [Bacteroidales bacterium]
MKKPSNLSKARAMLPFFLILLFVVSSTNAQVILEKALSDRTTSYKMDVELDTDAKTVSGDLILTWTNPSLDTVSDLQFHMYLNAFKNSKSTMFNEGSVFHRDEDDFGFVDVNSIHTLDGKDLSAGVSFIMPDQKNHFQELRLSEEVPTMPDGSIQDETVMRVVLDEGVLPGESIQVKISFTSKLPDLKKRTGFSQNYFFVAQWFPKLAVYEYPGMKSGAESGWNCHQFHRSSEFYANHSLYEIDLTLPDDYILGSGGMVMAEENLGNGKKKVSLRAEDIVDFAWTASKDYVVVEDQWKHVKIRALFQAEHLYQAERHINALKEALAYLDEHVGRYPWPHATLIDPPTSGQAAGGMEYTTLFTAGTAYGLPKGLRMPELVTIHEFGHAYFMGILATNEFDEPWMDEGMNTYWETRIMDHVYGDKHGVIDLPFIHIGDKEFARFTYVGMNNPKIADAYRPSWEFPHGSYGSVIYQKTATWLNTLERMISTETMDEVFKTYFKRWAFKHPGTQDFIDVVNEVVTEHHGDRFGENLDWYFDTFLKDDKTVDYKVISVSSRRVYQDAGIFGKADSKLFIEQESEEDLYRSTVALERLGEAIVPVDILIHFEDGTEIIEYWNGKDRAKDLIYERSSRVEWACIDPEMKILMDTNLLNNSVTTKANKKPALKYGSKFMFLIQNLMQLISIFS